MENSKKISEVIQSVAVWQDGQITLPAYLWEQLYNELNPTNPIHDFTESGK